jgi:tripartite-type tricarboxylate transporter receptor subunit TctC
VDVLVESGNVKVIAQTGMLVDGKVLRSSSFPDVPLLAEEVTPKLEGLALRSFVSWQRQAQIGKWLALPPKTPDEIVQVYRKAFQEMLKDTEFKTVFEKTENPDFQAMSVKDLDALMLEMVNTPDDTVNYLVKLRKKYGM